MQCGAIQGSELQYSTVQYSTVQCSSLRSVESVKPCDLGECTVAMAPDAGLMACFGKTALRDCFHQETRDPGFPEGLCSPGIKVCCNGLCFAGCRGLIVLDSSKRVQNLSPVAGVTIVLH